MTRIVFALMWLVRLLPMPAIAATGNALGRALFWLIPERRKVTIGRDHEADFPIRDDRVSRAHAMIEHRRGHFFVVDHSGNGTYVTLEGRPEIHVHREELTLLGHGWITFGRPRAEATQAVEFRVTETWRPDKGGSPDS